MVNSTEARQDVESLLTKTITYQKYSTAKTNLAYDTISRNSATEYDILAQVTVQSITSELVKEGTLLMGDLVGLFRYEYTEEADGTAISPTLVPKQGDRIKFLGKPYTIKTCTPATSEDDGIIGWDFTAGQSGNE